MRQSDAGVWLVIVLAVIALFFTVPINYASVAHTEIQITRDPERDCNTTDGNSSCRWLIYTEDEVFENVDNILFFKFNSADVIRVLEEDQTYCAKVNGFRVPFLSWFRNVIEVKPGNCPV